MKVETECDMHPYETDYRKRKVTSLLSHQNWVMPFWWIITRSKKKKEKKKRMHGWIDPAKVNNMHLENR